MKIGKFLRSLKIFEKSSPRKSAVTIATEMHAPATEDMWKQLEKQREEEFLINKKLREGSIPDSAGLYPHEILMLSFAEKYLVGDEKFQQFWRNKYAVDDPAQIISSLVDRGFLCISPVKEKLDCLNVSQLKDILRQSGLKVSGNKPELIRRILDNATEEDLSAHVAQRYYTATEKGKNEIANNEYVLYMHNYPYTNITVWSMNKLMQGYPAKLYRDRIWAELNRLELEQDNILSNSLKYQKIEFLIEESRFSEALPILVLALYNSLNYIIPKQYSDRLEIYRFYGKKYQNMKPDSVCQSVNLACGTVFRDICKCHNALMKSEPNLNALISSVWVHLGCEDALFNKSEFVDLISAKINGNEDAFNAICKRKEIILEKGGYNV